VRRTADQDDVVTGAREHRAEEAADRAGAHDGDLSKRIAHAAIVGRKKSLHRRREQLCA
jgi:hypothetical protein